MNKTMEDINFNNYSKDERYEIISSFLQQAHEDKCEETAEKFFEFYFDKYYKIPLVISNDMIYCQRSIKTHLSVHQMVVKVFEQQKDADPVEKNRIIGELESILYELNAECQYMTLKMEEDIDRFCLVFKENKIKCNDDLIKMVISRQIVPPICQPNLILKPTEVRERDSEQALIERFFTYCPDDENYPPQDTTVSNENIIETVDITDDDDIHAEKKIFSHKTNKCYNTQKVIKPKPKQPLSITEYSKNIGFFKERARSVNEVKPKQSERRPTELYIKKNEKHDALQHKPVPEDSIEASRLNFLAVLKRARNESTKADNSSVPSKRFATTKVKHSTQSIPEPIIDQSAVELKDENDSIALNKSGFLQIFGLCNHEEYRRMLQAQSQLKRRSFSKVRAMQKQKH